MALGPDPLYIIAHRGASGERPEHTLEAYRLAVEQGADVIEPDLVITRDGVLVARHENEISGTTDVAERPEFADRKTTKRIDGREVTGWFTEDFSVAEIKTLRAVERIPDLRPQSAAFDGQFEVPTLAEILALLDDLREQTGRPIGLYPETKHATYFRRMGLPLEFPLVSMLHDAGHFAPVHPVWIQSFEPGGLELMRGFTALRLVQLLQRDGGPADRLEMTFEEMATPDGLATIATYADAIGVAANLVLDPVALHTTRLVENAHARRLAVHVWTVRPENAFLPESLRLGDDPAAHGDLAAYVSRLASAQIDGLFTDTPGLVRAALGW